MFDSIPRRERGGSAVTDGEGAVFEGLVFTGHLDTVLSQDHLQALRLSGMFGGDIDPLSAIFPDVIELAGGIEAEPLRAYASLLPPETE